METHPRGLESASRPENDAYAPYSNMRIWALDGDKLGKAERAGGSGWGVADGDVMYTLSVKDAGTHGVAIAYAEANSQDGI